MHTAPRSGFFPSAPQMQTNHRRHLRSRSLQEPDISRPPQFAGGAGVTERAVACLGQSGHRETKPGLCLHSLSKAWKKKKCVHQNVLFFFFSITVVRHEFRLINMTHGIILKKLIKCSGAGFSTSKRSGVCEAMELSLSQAWAGRGALFTRCRVTCVSVSVILNVCGGTGPHRESLWTGPGNGETQKKTRA